MKPRRRRRPADPACARGRRATTGPTLAAACTQISALRRSKQTGQEERERRGIRHASTTVHMHLPKARNAAKSAVEEGSLNSASGSARAVGNSKNKGKFIWFGQIQKILNSFFSKNTSGSSYLVRHVCPYVFLSLSSPQNHITQSTKRKHLM